MSEGKNCFSQSVELNTQEIQTSIDEVKANYERFQKAFRDFVNRFLDMDFKLSEVSQNYFNCELRVLYVGFNRFIEDLQIYSARENLSDQFCTRIMILESKANLVILSELLSKSVIEVKIELYEIVKDFEGLRQEIKIEMAVNHMDSRMPASFDPFVRYNVLNDSVQDILKIFYQRLVRCFRINQNIEGLFSLYLGNKVIFADPELIIDSVHLIRESIALKEQEICNIGVIASAGLNIGPELRLKPEKEDLLVFENFLLDKITYLDDKNFLDLVELSVKTKRFLLPIFQSLYERLRDKYEIVCGFETGGMRSPEIADFSYRVFAILTEHGFSSIENLPEIERYYGLSVTISRFAMSSYDPRVSTLPT